MGDQHQQKFDVKEPNNRKFYPAKDSSKRLISFLKIFDMNDEQTHMLPWRFLISTIGGVFLAEMADMVFMYIFPALPNYLQFLLDNSIMAVSILPLLYLFSFRPLLLYMEKHRRVENALRQSQERFAIVYRSNPAALSITAVKNGRFTEVNESFLRLYGYDRNEVIGYTPNELNLYPDPNEQEKLKWLLLKQRSVDSFEMTTRIKSGDIRNISVSTEAIELDGEVNILAIATDITELKQASEFIKRERQRFYDVLEALPAYVLLLTPDHHINFANRFFREQFGDAIGLRCYKYLFGRDEPCEVCETFKVLNDMKPGRWELIMPDSHIYDVSDHPFIDADGSTLILEMGIDITERKRAETAIRQLSRIVEQTEDTVVVTDRDGFIEYINPSFERLTGFSKEEALGVKPNILKSGLHNEQFYKELWDTILSGNVFLSEIANCKKSGELFYEVKTITPLRDEEGKITHFVATGKDITKNKLDQEKLLKAYDELEIRVQERTTELRIANSELEDEIQTRQQMEDALRQSEQQLRKAHDELELRIQERTEELAVKNRELVKEITERKEVEKRLRIQTTAMQAAANGIIITDRQGNIQWTNPALTQITGYETNELIEQNTRIFNSGKHDAAFYYQMWDTILSGRIWRGETINRRKDGSLYTEEQTITPVYDESNQILHFIAVKQDITKRKQAEAELEKRNIEVQAISVAEHEQRQLAEALVKAALVLNKSLRLEKVFALLLEQVNGVIPYQLADIILLEDETFYDASHRGDLDWPENQIGTYQHFLLDNFPLLRTMRESGQPALVLDTQQEPDWITVEGLAWSRSFLSAPLIVETKVIGSVNLFAEKPGFFTSKMSDRLVAFAAHAAVAIQNARLYEAEQYNRKLAEVLSRSSIDLVQTLEINVVMETLLDYTKLILSYDMAFIFLSESENSYVVRAVRGSASQQKLLLDQSIDLLNDPFLRSIFENKGSIYISDSKRIPDWNPPPELDGMRTLLGIPLGSTDKTIGMLIIASTNPASFSDDNRQIVNAVAAQSVVALQNAWLFEQIRSGRERLQQLSHRLVETQENERKYIARELHDETSQALTSIKLGLQLIEQNMPQPEILLEHLKRLKDLVDEVLEGLHNLAANLRPATLDHLGLIETLNSLVVTVGKRSGLAARFKNIGQNNPGVITEEMEISIYRIIQESLTNVVRHARASYADVILEWQEEKVIIMVEDNGIGFNMKNLKKANHFGLIGIQERVELLSGNFVLDSAPQQGTTLVVEIPYVH